MSSPMKTWSHLCTIGNACFLVASSLQSAYAQHGVIREYAALAPKPEAVPLAPLFDAPLTDISIAVGPDKAYYLTGSAVDRQSAVFSNRLSFWRSTDLKQWTPVRTLDLKGTKARSPELHFLAGRFWLTLGCDGGGTELLCFDTKDLASSSFQQARVTERGEDPSLFRDDDGTFYWIMGAGEIARMKANPLEGLVGPPTKIPVKIAGPKAQQTDQTVKHLRGAFLAKINGKYHLFVTARLFRNGLGRTGLAAGVDDVLVAASEKPDAGYSDFYVAFPNAGQTTLFHDTTGTLWATYSGNDQRAILRGQPGAFRVELVAATEAAWTIGFAGSEKGERFPFGLMLRPDTSFIYERGTGSARAVPLDKVPGQRAAVPWIRDTFIMVGHDGTYYLTGTSGNMDGINLWRSLDLKRFEFVKQVWTPATDPAKWYNRAANRLFWAPELHYIKGSYWIAFCLNAGDLGKNSLLKSTSGRPEGPYESAFSENRGVDPHIDSSLFQDTDGSVYYVWQDGLIRKLNAAMNGFDGEARKILPADGQRVGYEGATLVKIGTWYVLTCAEWNGGGNHADGTYDMMYSCAKSLTGPWKARRVAVPHAGHGALFKDKSGRWLASFFGNDRTAPFRAMPGFVCVETEDTGDDLVIRPQSVPLQTDHPTSHGLAAARSGPRTVETSSQPVAINPGTPWPASDALGRSLPTAPEVSLSRADRWVGIFYFLTHGTDRTELPNDIAKILLQDAEILKKPESPLWGPRGPYYWGQPLYGYYNSTDQWVLRRHASLLADAGIDTVIFDTTNRRTYPEVYRKICEVWSQVRKQGGCTPQICFMANTKAGETVQELYHDLYQPGLYPELWFRWQGRPLLICNPTQASPEVAKFFTLRAAHWPFTLVNTHNEWHWESTYPQVYSYDEDPAKPEQVNVAVAQNLRDTDGKVTNMSEGNARGRSFHHGKKDTSADAVNHGYNFAEQWQRALELDPPFVMVTGWNEWTAGKFSRPGRPVVFVDQFDQEYSRDIEPVAGLHSDNYYYQLVANVRRYKGAPPLPLASPLKTINIDGEFAQWHDVGPEFVDHAFDNDHRDFGQGAVHYVNHSGRNDLTRMKVARDATTFYFYAQTRETITPRTGPNWMWLLIDADQNPRTGWEGYDFIINRIVEGEDSWLEQNAGGWTWKKVARVQLKVQGNELMLSVPRTALGLVGAEPFTFDFKWWDNSQRSGDILDTYLSGDVAPDGRFKYRYRVGATRP